MSLDAVLRKEYAGALREALNREFVWEPPPPLLGPPRPQYGAGRVSITRRAGSSDPAIEVDMGWDDQLSLRPHEARVVIAGLQRALAEMGEPE